MHVVTSICDPDGATETLPPQEVTSMDELPVSATQYSFDTEEEAMAHYSELKPQPSFLFTADCHMKHPPYPGKPVGCCQRGRRLSP